MKNTSVDHASVLVDIRQLIEHARQRAAAAAAVNAELALLYWQIGRRIQIEVLQRQRAEYGKQIIATLAQQLTADYGKGWSEKQLRHCLRVAETFTDEIIFSTVRRELSWSHIKTLMYLNDSLKRDFYLLDFLGLRDSYAEKRELIPFVVSRELVERSNALLSSSEGHEWNQRRVA
ncbi:MAG: DUF1016 N-terminal domain-containing protein [Methylobacter sp.]|nr:DUF1016 N-terminal domain-containing protein [Methylobacter sp.]